MSAPGLLSKISSLFNNPLYSDIEFIFGPDADQKVYCHKLILALRSKAFSHMFFESENSLSIVRLPAEKSASFSLLFKFLYTDEVTFNTYDEAEDLLVLADEFAVEELVLKCRNYIAQNRLLTINNVLQRYELALKNNIEVLLKDCRDFVCSNIQQIFKSDSFASASLDLVEDIVKQDDLCVSTELEVIKAVLNWGSASLKRRNMLFDEKFLRVHVNPLMKYLRILTLSSLEFEYVVKNYSLFTGYESMQLTKKILQPKSDVELPDDICNVIVGRNGFKPKPSDVKYSAQSNQAELVKSNGSKSVNFELPEYMSNDKISYEVKKHNSEPSKSSDTESLSEMDKIVHEVQKSILKERKPPSARYRPRNRSKPSFTIEKAILTSNQSVSQIRLRSYEFPLQENEESFKSSFRNDLTNSITFKMKSGNLYLYGLELKVKNKSTSPEEFEADIYLRGFSRDSFSKKYKQELKNNVFTIKFPKPMKLQEGNQGELEVSIENLYLNRYYACVINGPFELNNGLSFACEFSVESNKKDDCGVLFSISRLIYVPS